MQTYETVFKGDSYHTQSCLVSQKLRSARNADVTRDTKGIFSLGCMNIIYSGCSDFLEKFVKCGAERNKYNESTRSI